MALVVPIVAGAIGSFVGRKAFEKTRKKSFEKFQYDFFRLFFLLGIYFVASYFMIKYFEFTIGVNGVLADIAGFFGFTPFRPSNPKHQELLQRFFISGIGSEKLNFTAWDLVKFGAVIFVSSEWASFSNLKKIDPEHQPSAITHAIFALIVTFLTLITIPKITKQLAPFITERTASGEREFREGR